MASLFSDRAENAPTTIRDQLARWGLKNSIKAVEQASAIQDTIGSPKDRPPSDKITVGIIGAGCAGLYAAMMLQDLGIKFEILEASDRIGGRVRTHHFSDDKHDYYDVGAMRFPRLWFMRRLTVDLFHKLEFDTKDKIVPYYMDPLKDRPDDDQHTYDHVRQFYNNRPFVGQTTPPGVDVFGVGKNDPSGEGIVPQEYVAKGAGNLVSASFQLIISIFAGINKRDIDPKVRIDMLRKADEAMRKIDTFSTRSWLKVFGIPPGWITDDGKLKTDRLVDFPTLDDLLKAMNKPDSGLGYPPAVIQWIETTQTGTTGWYDMALTQTLMELADFGDQALGVDGWRPDSGALRDYKWVCVDGGSEDIAKAMLAKIGSDKAIINKRVTGIFRNTSKDGLSVKVAGEELLRTYDQVICTATLGCMATMDLDECTSYAQRVAIRCLQYDASCKIGVQFSTRWWQDADFMKGKPIYGGVSKSDLPLSNVVYPSYGAEDDAPGVLICSYTWAQDARRLGALIGPGGAMSQELRDLVVRDLAKIHALPEQDPVKMKAEVQRLQKEIDSRIKNSFAFAWYNDPNYRGAFAIFGPSQFYDTAPADQRQGGGASLFDSVKVPGAGGKFHIAGEATSTHHGWIIGALNSAWRTVNNVIKGCSDEDALRARLIRPFEDGGWETPDEEPEQKVIDRGYKLGMSGGW